MTSDWHTRALCAQTGGDWWYADDTPKKWHEINTAITICRMCDVQTPCLETALKNDERFGVWGGLTANQRLKLRRQRGIPPKPQHLEPCGTTAAARRHQRRHEPLCPKCSDAIRQERQRRRNTP